MVTTRNNTSEDRQSVLRPSTNTNPPSSSATPGNPSNDKAPQAATAASGTWASSHTKQGQALAADRDQESEESLSESIESTLTGHDEPMEREHPKAPGALIWFSYPLALLLVLLVAAIFSILVF